MLRQLSVFFVTLTFALPLPGTAAPLEEVDAVGWLAGCWEGEGGGGKNQECWMVPEGGVMLGVSRVISEKGTMFEFLRIAPHDNGLAYLASPRGKPAVAFPLVETAEGFAVFANPGHDFPQRITYRREGAAMTARVEAQRGGKWGGFDITWKRVPGGQSGGWPQPSASAADLERQVRETETAFAETMADRDHEAFAAFLSPEAVFLSSTTARGRDQVAAKWKKHFEAPEAPFSWQPETVEVLDSSSLALSTGPVHDADGKLISRFTSVWRQEAPGEWRIIFDKGDRVCEE